MILLFFIFLIFIWALFDSFSSSKSEPVNRNEKNEYIAPRKSTYNQSYKKAKTNRTFKKAVQHNSIIKSNKDILLKAINLNKNVTFRYVDKNGQETFREVSPKKVFWYEFGEEGRMECLDAHCLLRSESRTFALFRISNLSIK